MLSTQFLIPSPTPSNLFLPLTPTPLDSPLHYISPLVSSPLHFEAHHSSDHPLQTLVISPSPSQISTYFPLLSSTIILHFPLSHSILKARISLSVLLHPTFLPPTLTRHLLLIISILLYLLLPPSRSITHFLLHIRGLLPLIIILIHHPIHLYLRIISLLPYLSSTSYLF